MGLPVRLTVCDGKVYTLWKPLVDRLRQESPVITVAGGETAKSLPTARRLWKKLWQYRIDKGQAVLLIGGGSVLDLGGFCAATWKRGVPFISVPTTFIAQIDAAIGGKTGLNFKEGKNLLGVYAQPVAILGYRGFLETLPKPEVRGGWAEAIKHALIVGGDLWEKLQGVSFKEPPSMELLAELAAVKVNIVRQDPYEEKGLRHVLNLGHTLGHVWETLSLRTERPLSHGEAVAIGLLQEGYLSLPPAALEALRTLMERAGLLNPLPDFTWKAWEKALLQDKKIRDGQLRMPLLQAIGQVKVDSLPIQALREATRWYRQEVRP